MPENVNPSVNTPIHTSETAAAVQYGGGTDGWIVPDDERLVEDSNGQIESGPLDAFDMYSPDSHSLSTEDSHVRGFTWDGSSFWITSDSSERVYEYDQEWSYTGNSFDTSGETLYPGSIAWDGSSFWVTHYEGSTVYEYDSSGSYTGNSFDTSGEDSTLRGITWDGSSLWVVGVDNDRVYEYDSTGTYTGNSFSTEFQMILQKDITWDGSSFWILDGYESAVFEHTTSGSTGTKFSVQSEVYNEGGVAWDGSSFWVADRDDATVHPYYGSPPSYIGGLDLVIENGEAVVGGAHLATDEENRISLPSNTSGEKVYLGWDSDNGNTIIVGKDSAFDSDDARVPIWEFDTDSSSITSSTDLRTLRRTITPERVETSDYKEVPKVGYPSSNYDLSTKYFIQQLDVRNSEIDEHSGVLFNDDGSKLYVSEPYNREVHEYNLSTEYDISTASHSTTLDTTSDTFTHVPTGIAWNDDGTKLFISDLNGIDGTQVVEYELSIAYDIGTASFSQSLDLSSRTTNINEVSWNNNGSKMFFVDRDNDNVLEYDVSTEYDISTASFSQSLDISNEDTGMSGMAWNEDGTKMHLVGEQNANIYEYDLTDSFDIGTASFTQSYDVSTEDSTPRDITWEWNNSRVYVVGAASCNVYEYGLDTSYTVDISKSNYQYITLNGDTSFDFINEESNLTNFLKIRLKQDYVGGRTITWPDNVEWDVGGNEPDWSMHANAVDLVRFDYDPERDVWYGMPEGLDFA